MWSSVSVGFGRFEPKRSEKINFKGVVFMSLDSGIAWSIVGERYPSSKKWTWCVSDSSLIISYIDQLWDNNLLPILHSQNAEIDVINEMLSEFKTLPPTFTGVNLNALRCLVFNSWSEQRMLSLCNLPSIGYIIDKNPSIHQIGTSEPTLGPNLSMLNILHLDILRDIKEHQLLVLVGQEGSGRSDVLLRLEALGWYVFNSKQSAEIERALPNSERISRLKDLIANIGKESSLTRFGFVVDTSNPTHKNRSFYMRIAKECKVKASVGWITYPGYFTKDYIKVPDFVLKNYTETLEIPSSEENVIRII